MKQEGEAPAAPILWPTCRWSSVSWFVVGLKPMCVIEKILRHLGLWDIHNHDPPQAVISEPIPELVYM